MDQGWSDGVEGSGRADGPGQSLGDVVDANGALVGQSVGQYPAGVSVFFVTIDGGAYIYYPNGWLVPIAQIPSYDNSSCAGTPFIMADDTLERDAILQDPSYRVVYRATSPTLGPASAYKPDGTATPVLNLARWELDDTGTCTAAMAETGYRLPLTGVTAPPDHPGPLRMA